MNSYHKISTGSTPRQVLSATAVSRGLAVGTAVCLYGRTHQYLRSKVDNAGIAGEADRFHIAFESVREELTRLRHSKTFNAVSAQAIFDTHLLILENSGIAAEVEQSIKGEHINAEWALSITIEKLLAQQSNSTEPGFRDASTDIEDIADRLFYALEGTTASFPSVGPGSVVVASVIRPSTLVELASRKPAAIVTEHGGWTSHSFIMAREMAIPAVTGLKNALQLIADGTAVEVDGFTGTVTLHPTAHPDALTSAGIHNAPAPRSKTPESGLGLSTLDGREVVLRLNAERGFSAASPASAITRGVGLLRSEYFFADPGVRYPDEDLQAQAYAAVAEACGADGVRIRTFDFNVGAVGFYDLARESNPALGLRAIRLSLAEPEPFRVQIRAILRASANGNVSIVLPMVSGVEEIQSARAIIDDEAGKLDGAVIVPKIGAMIEVPSAVLTIEDIVRHVDFICLGTNDLVQYLLAADRDNEAVAGSYQTLHPSVLKAISTIIRAADMAGLSTMVCGEMAASIFYVPLLVGLGAREFSMNSNAVEAVRQVIANISFDEASELARHAQTLFTAQEIETHLKHFYLDKWPHLFTHSILSSLSS